MNAPLKSVIVSHPFFRNLSPPHAEIAASCATEEAFKPEQILFREGQPAGEFYLIQSGRVALEAHDPGDGTVRVQTLGAGDVLGWSWLFAPFTWHFQARALEPTRAIVLNGAHLLVAAERDHDFGYELIKRVSQVVISRLQHTRQQLLAREVESALKG